MQKVFLDTNILLDLLLKREHYREAQIIFTLAHEKKLALYLSALSIANSNYTLLKTLSQPQINAVMLRLYKLVNVLPLNAETIRLSHQSNFNDFEDGLQYYTAKKYGINIIVTRNKNDYSHVTDINILTPFEFLSL